MAEKMQRRTFVLGAAALAGGAAAYGLRRALHRP